MQRGALEVKDSWRGYGSDELVESRQGGLNIKTPSLLLDKNLGSVMVIEPRMILPVSLEATQAAQAPATTEPLGPVASTLACPRYASLISFDAADPPLHDRVHEPATRSCVRQVAPGLRTSISNLSLI
jgi:hypothetical protein